MSTNKDTIIFDSSHSDYRVKNIIKKLDLEKMEILIKQRWITRNVHPSGDLFIYNYTPEVMYDNVWTDETLQCRGLIADKEGNIVARPFPKFFNLEQHQGKLPDEPFEVYEKLDGSLGILYFYKNEPYIATRGSFVSPQAVVANRMLRNYFKKDKVKYLDSSYTYLFEIIYPENRIVVNYGNESTLVFLAAIETETGKEIDREHIIADWDWDYDLEIPMCKKHYFFEKTVNDIANLNIPNKEGFVLRFKSGLRIKIKFKDYVKLHSLITQVTEKKIWDVIRNNKNFDEFIGNIPDELYGWIKQTEFDLRKDFQAIEETARLALKKVLAPYRKDIAMGIKDHSYAHIMFAMLDNKDYQKVIWDMLEPPHEIPVIDGLNFYKEE